MARWARWCFTHRKRVVIGWLLALIIVAGLGKAVGTSFNTNFSLPGTDSQGGDCPRPVRLPTGG